MRHSPNHRGARASFTPSRRNRSGKPRTWCGIDVESLERRQLLAGAVSANPNLHTSPRLTADAGYVAPGKFLYHAGGFLTRPAAGAPLDIARQYLLNNAAGLGLKPADITEAVVTSQYTDRDSGTTYIYLRQMLNGLAISNADMNVAVLRDGRILSVGHTFVANLAAQKPGTVPALSAAAGLSKAAANLGLALQQAPAQNRPAAGIGRVQTFSAPEISTDPVATQLHYVATGGGVKLAWNYIINVPGGEHWYDANVDGNTGAMLWTSDFVDNFVDPTLKLPFGDGSGPQGNQQPAPTNPSRNALYNASYNVYARPLLSPSSGPRTSQLNPWDLAGSPFGWQDTNGTPGGDSNVTAGNNVDSHDDRDANNTGGIQASGGALAGDGSGSLNFDFPIDFSLEPTTANNQLAAITNLYYWNNVLHDVHYKYGFTEAAGNFQLNNYGNGGLGNDRVQADAQDGSGTNNANFATPVDGQSGRMQMYLFTAPTPDRDGDLDAQVMIHEYGHGVSNRLTGGPGNSSALNATQSGGMGEGWGDWWGLMLLQTDGSASAQQAAYPVGTYVLNQPLNGAGIRRQPYSYNAAINTQSFAWYGTGGSNGGSTQVHNTGELWVGALWDMAWNLINKYGFDPDVSQGYGPGSAPAGKGNLLALRLVMDALKLQPANPSFVQARDAILAADQALNGGADSRDLWQAFARRGLGFSASTASSSSTSFTEAFDLPPTLFKPFVTGSSPSGTIADQPITGVTINFSRPMDTTSFSVVDDVQSFSGPSGNMLAQISGFTWTNNQTLVINVNPTRANGAYSMVIGPNILDATGGALDQNGNDVAGEAGDTYNATFSKSGSVGPRVTAQSPTGAIVNPTLSTITLTFSENMNQTSFDVASDVVSFVGPGGNNLKPTISGFTWTDAKNLKIDFAAASTDGTYTLSVGPSILAAVDNVLMDQNANGTAGESVADRYSGSVTLDRFPGPDAGGYEASPVPLQTIDLVIGAPGVTTVVNASDDAAGTLTLPAGNTFTFYGTQYTTLFPNANGLIAFGTSTTAFTNSDLTTTPTQAAIAIAWDDWRTDQTGPAPATDSAVLWKLDGNNLIVEWSDVTNRTSSQGTATFQAILSLNTGTRNGDIIGNYPDLSISNVTYNEGASATLGIKNSGTQGTSRLLVQNNVAAGAFMGTGKAVRFTATAASGVVFADDNGNGVQDGGEVAVPFAHLYRDGNNNGALDGGENAVFADAAGAYTMTSLFEGDNLLRIDSPTIINTQPNPAVNLLMGENGTARNVGAFDTALVGIAGDDTLNISTNAADDRAIMSLGARNYSILKSVLTKLSFAGGTGSDIVNVSFANGNPFANFASSFLFTGTGNDTINFTGNGSFTYASDPALATPTLTVTAASGATVNFNAAGGTHLSGLSLTAGGKATVGAGGNKVLVTLGLTISGAGSNLDLFDNDMIVRYSGGSVLSAVQGLINAARTAAGTWTGSGVNSTSARTASPAITTLGAMESGDYKSVYGANATFDGESLAGNSVVVKYTYYGDADFNGKVNFDDYTRVDAGFNGTRSGWINGDFNGSGSVNFDDYTLIDAAFNSQGVVL